MSRRPWWWRAAKTNKHRSCLLIPRLSGSSNLKTSTISWMVVTSQICTRMKIWSRYLRWANRPAWKNRFRLPRWTCSSNILAGLRKTFTWLLPCPRWVRFLGQELDASLRLSHAQQSIGFQSGPRRRFLVWVVDRSLLLMSIWAKIWMPVSRCSRIFISRSK